jgi:hypothetical protein
MTMQNGVKMVVGLCLLGDVTSIGDYVHLQGLRYYRPNSTWPSN